MLAPCFYVWIRIGKSNVRSQEGVELISDESDANVAKAASETIEEIVSSMGQAPPLPESSSDIFRILCRYVLSMNFFQLIINRYRRYRSGEDVKK